MFNLFRSVSLAQECTKYRPLYPESIYKSMYEYCTHKSASGLDLAIDLGCGEGGSTIPLSKYFKKVIGVDISKTQIEEAMTKIPKGKDVSFRVGQAENLDFLENTSVDLIAVGTAVHWMNTDEMNQEIVRVLKPGGTVALYDYDDQVVDNNEADRFLTRVFYEEIVAATELPLERVKYRVTDYKFPFETAIRQDGIKMEHSWTVDEFMGYFLTVSSNATYRRMFPDSTMFEDIKKRLKQFYKADKMFVSFPGRIVFGRKFKNIQ